MMEFLFFNQVGRVRSGWRFLLFAFAFLFCGTVVDGTLFLVAKDSPVLQDFLVGNGGFVLQNLVTLSLAGALGIILQKKLEGLPAKTLGWTFQSENLRQFIFGFGIGALTLLISVLIVLAAGAVSFQLNNTSAIAEIVQSFLVSLTIFTLGAAAEETLFRGYPLQTFTRARLAIVAILITSLFFALVHENNPNVIPIFTFTNTALAGIWMTVGYLKTRTLWLPFAMHFSWNWMMNQFFGIPVSGITQISSSPFLKSIDSKSLVWLSGGDYGIEGGAACTVALLISIVLLWLAPFLKPNQEMLALTNQENPVQTNTEQTV